MSIFSYLTPAAIGPVWPFMLLAAAFMATTTGFLLLARARAWLHAYSLREYRFLHRLYDATEMFSTIAILSGMLGTCLGLLEVLPVLARALQNSGNGDVLQQVLTPLRNVWASTVAGLIIGGLWGETLAYFLKPYTRPTLLALSSDEPPEEPFTFGEAGNSLPGDDVPLDQDWRNKDKEGMY